ncbi:HAD family phosphatase [Virgibacillus sp. NKC19-3]|uniref:Cof-type HAD-IIB family hydrolase n=1 Tax=Virgibacillus saliphilus TaxID=2831674 RepID=UPI001C9B1CD3|nr:Cof-type HAD-IIB family hydrolase [Virgibacillus sp. NKC19-3]MBY7144139.1 HAD family phosphatase [Virgibacillus sp. NKC19-3]
MAEKKNIKLIALDMDGTLLNNALEISEPTQAVIAKALAGDIHVVLSTGRSLGTCYPYAALLNLTSYLVTSNGGEIFTMDKTLLDQHLLDTEKIKNMWEMGEEMGVQQWMVSTTGIYRDSRPANFYDHDWLKYGCSSLDKRKLDAMIEELSYFEGLELTNSLPTNVEANPAGVSKAAALHFVCREIGITMDEIMAIGDSLNDIKMIQEAGIGVAMENAQKAIKNVADYVTDTNDQDGVAKAIERFAL